MTNTNVLHEHLMPVYLAEVKLTGAIVIVRKYDYKDYEWICDMQLENGVLYKTSELNFIKNLNA